MVPISEIRCKNRLSRKNMKMGYLVTRPQRSAYYRRDISSPVCNMLTFTNVCFVFNNNYFIFDLL